MKEIMLTNGSLVKVSDEDYDRIVKAGNWYEDHRGHGARFYAYRRFNNIKVYMHVFILGKSSQDIDHINGDGLDNQRLNLRHVSRGQNNMNNHTPRLDNKTGTRGVYFDTTFQRFKAEIKINGRKIGLGSYKNLTDAIQARKTAESRLEQGITPKVETKNAQN